jgi:hypothetical protein
LRGCAARCQGLTILPPPLLWLVGSSAGGASGFLGCDASKGSEVFPYL